jgi:hypothetical protein
MNELGSSETIGLRFNTGDDSLDYAKQLVERCDRLASGKSCSIVERYKRTDTYLHGDIFGHRGTQIAQFSLLAIPFANLREVKPADKSIIEAETSIGHSHFSECSMNFPVPHLVESIEGCIPSILRIKGTEGQKEGLNGVRDFGAIAIKILSGLLLSPPERELGVLRIGPSRQNDGAIKDGMVEAGSKAIESIEQDDRQKFRHIDSNSSLENSIPVLRIFISELSVGIAFDESFFEGFKFTNVSFRSAQQYGRTLE